MKKDFAQERLYNISELLRDDGLSFWDDIAKAELRENPYFEEMGLEIVLQPAVAFVEGIQIRKHNFKEQLERIYSHVWNMDQDYARSLNRIKDKMLDYKNCINKLTEIMDRATSEDVLVMDMHYITKENEGEEGRNEYLLKGEQLFIAYLEGKGWDVDEARKYVEMLSEICPYNLINLAVTNSFSSHDYEIIVEQLYEKAEIEKNLMNMVNIAIGEYGTIEEEDNHVSYNEWFYNDDLGAAWCSAFVMWCANEAGLLNGIILPTYRDIRSLYFEGVDNVKQWYIDQNRYYSMDITSAQYSEDYEVKAGDFFVSMSYDNGTRQNHIGIVVAVGDGVIYTIEGNSHDQVRGIIRPYGSITSGSEGVQGFCSNGGILLGDIPEGIEFIYISGENDGTR